MRNFEKTIKTIYQALSDDESRMIYEARLNYSLTGSERYMRAVIETAERKIKATKEWHRLYGSIVTASRAEGVWIYGCGMYGKELVRMVDDIMFKGFVDRNANNDVFGYQVVTPDDFQAIYADEYVVISSRDNRMAMTDTLMEMGVAANKIIDGSMLPIIIDSFQYFDLKELPRCDREIFADVGSYDGMTSVRFIDWCKGSGECICFEPDKRNISRIRRTSADYGIDTFTIIPKGAWSESTTLRFASDRDTVSHIAWNDESADSSIEVAKLDDELAGKKITFIKMDIEGAEYEALRGAKEIIEKDKPKLAICVYHKPEDIWEIPSIILRFRPDYRFFLRHYSLHNGETVMYGI